MPPVRIVIAHEDLAVDRALDWDGKSKGVWSCRNRSILRRGPQPKRVRPVDGEPCNRNVVYPVLKVIKLVYLGRTCR